LEAVVKTINVRILVRDELDDDVAVNQLLRGVVKLHGAVELLRNDAGQLVPAPTVHKRPHIVWSGQETRRDDS
jgi:hypothetical protein